MTVGKIVFGKPGVIVEQLTKEPNEHNYGTIWDKTMKNKIINECDFIKEMLIEKNKAYGDSAAKPINIFSKASAEEQLKTRLDDKLKRLINGNEYPGDDTVLDLIGYMILLRIVEKDNKLHGKISQITTNYFETATPALEFKYSTEYPVGNHGYVKEGMSLPDENEF